MLHTLHILWTCLLFLLALIGAGQVSALVQDWLGLGLDWLVKVNSGLMNLAVLVAVLFLAVCVAVGFAELARH
jgi:hypothetical protein